jgi:hypothetical protein
MEGILVDSKDWEEQLAREFGVKSFRAEDLAHLRPYIRTYEPLAVAFLYAFGKNYPGGPLQYLHDLETRVEERIKRSMENERQLEELQKAPKSV